MFNAKHNLLPASSSHHVQSARITHRYNLRIIHDFERLEYRTLVRERYVGVIGPKFWNTLPHEITETSSVSQLKIKLKDYLSVSYI